MPCPSLRPVFPAIAVATVVIACGSGVTSGSGSDGGSGTDGGSDAGGNPCEGLGCASMPGPLLLHVLDASDLPVAHPAFAENGKALTPVCVSDAGFELDAGASCETWRFDSLFEGKHTITVAAPGYSAQQVTVTVQGPAGCCGQGPAVEQTVTLAPDSSDGGANDAGVGG